MERFSSLSEVKVELQKSVESLRNGNLRVPRGFSDEEEWISYLLNEFVVNWSFTFSLGELEQMYYPLFIGSKTLVNSSSFLQLVLSLCSSSLCVDKHDMELKLERYSQLLIHWIDQNQLQITKLFEEIFTNDIQQGKHLNIILQENNELISCLLSLPTKLSNIYQRNLPQEFEENNFIITLLGQSLRYLVNHQDNIHYSGAMFNIISRFLYIYPKQGKLIGEQIVAWWREYSITRECLQFVEKKSLAKFLFVIINQLKSRIRGVQHCFVNINSNNYPDAKLLSEVLENASNTIKPFSYLENIICNKFITSQQLEQNESLLTLLYSLYLIDNNESCKLRLFTIFQYVCEIWSQPEYLQRCTEKHHEYLSRIIIYIFQLYHDNSNILKESTIFPKIHSLLLKGIQNHISSPQNEYRRWGMMIAERFSLFFEIEKALEFEYEKIIDNEEDEIFESTPFIPIISEQKENEPTIVIKGFKEPDPDDIIDFDDDDEFDDSDEESDELEAFDLDDDMEDLRTVSVPVYLADCLRLLRDTENPDSLEAALDVIDNIIQRKPDDLHERSLDIGRSLLFLAPSLNDDDYLKKRIKALVSLTVNSTEIIVPYLTNQFYADNHNIQNRLDILQILTNSAQILSGNTPDDDNSISLPKEKVITDISPFEIVSEMTSDGFRNQPVGKIVKIREHPSHELSARIQEKTRIWGSLERRQAARPKPKVNKFDEFVGLFFFPLIKNFDNSKNRFNLMGEDSIVLAQLLYSLGVFLECSSCANTTGRRMIEHILQLNWVIRLHPEGFVRRSLVYSLSRAYLRSSKSFILQELENITILWKEYLEDEAEYDPDEQVRHLSLCCLMIMKEIMQN